MGQHEKTKTLRQSVRQFIALPRKYFKKFALFKATDQKKMQLRIIRDCGANGRAINSFTDVRGSNSARKAVSLRAYV